MRVTIAAALALVCTVAAAGCRQASEHPAPDSANARRESSAAAPIDRAIPEYPAPAGRASCLAKDSLFTYTDAPTRADERTGDVSGTRVTLHRSSRGWSGTGISLAGPEGIDPTLDSLTVDAAAGSIHFRMPLGFGGYWVVDGRFDCDSLWGTAHPGANPGEKSRVSLRRVRAGQ